MTAALLEQMLQDAPLGVHLTDTAQDLSAIHRPGIAAAIWQRTPLPSFQDWIDGLDSGLLPKARMILRPDAISDAVRHVCDGSGTPDCPERDMLIDDISALATIFAELMRARFLRVRLDVVNTNACRKFHVDAVTARLVCTYRGTGTQYGTAQGGKDPKRIFTVPASAPILLRGTRWPEQPASGLLHRSPPIEGSGETRLLLVLDPVFDPEEEV
ncbi:DUF1826 domain-containing protein [Aliiroseovarius marinus]|uniref:DUF1826 domain-containing protein n=1 Tax=Aliiroseovarius marinus TaxID=2500159 RepID=UPI001F0EBDC8|nr:DUF1826 domain-containing protein [Aliiroseovarius marinus]